MRAVFFRGKDFPLDIREFNKPQPVKDQVLVRLSAAALNHRDIWIRKEQSLSSGQGIILGSDGAGTVEAVADETDNSLIGKQVVINPSLDWGNNPTFQSDGFRILGYPDHGTFASWIVTAKKNVLFKPEHLNMEQAAAVPLSGLTAYRALFTKARLRPGEKVLITGIGGGAALWALQLAIAFQCKVYVTSSSQDKINRALALGATAGFRYTDSQWVDQAKKETRGFDVIVDSAGGKGFNELLEVASPGARVVIFGRTNGDITSLPPRLVFWKQLSVFGTTMGTRDELLSLIDFIEKKSILPVVDQVFPLTDIEQAMKRMELGEQFGKIVLRID